MINYTFIWFQRKKGVPKYGVIYPPLELDSNDAVQLKINLINYILITREGIITEADLGFGGVSRSVRPGFRKKGTPDV